MSDPFNKRDSNANQDELFLLFQRMMDALTTVQRAERALCKAVANLNTEDFAIKTRLRDEAVIKLEQAQEDVRLKRTQTLQKAKEQ